MACLVSISLSISLSSSKTPIQEIRSRRQALWCSLSQVTRGAAKKLHAPNSSGRGQFSVDRSCHHHIATPSRCFYEPISCHFGASSCIHTVISGFWVGPDPEDGWGFVEAFVNWIS
ncbi:uncharacterized protein LOC132286425 [Cornus florida]|uniref:uncharacterized protein LOC132286425 n=1 Tax=Cornus florida TaxID=4283 RepID=UPI002899A34D|nr:uncharacterized protein LOC132286425 [Cornus florida]